MKKILIIILLIIVLFLSGCISIDNPFDNEQNPDENMQIEEEITEENIEEEPETHTGVFLANDKSSSTWYWVYGYNSGFIAQTFSVYDTLTLTGIELKLEVISEPMDLTVEIQNIEDNKPNGVSISTGILDKTRMVSGWNKINLADIKLVSGKQYAFVAGIPDLEPGPVRIYTLYDEYNGGQAFYGNSFNPSRWYLRNDEDYLFRLWGEW